VETALLVAYLAVLVAAAVVTALKGKWGMLALGILFGLAWIVAALRLARPDSVWARRFYTREKQERAARVEPRRRRLAIVGAVVSLLFVVALFGLLKAYRIPSSAMEPTLGCAGAGPGCTAAESDRVVAVRYVFRKEPERGDIVTFETPERARADCGAGGVFVKRVVGLPGETWELRNGVVYIDGRRLDEPYVDTERRDIDSRPEKRIPEDHYLVLGDNRPQSCDSRVWGTLPRDNLIAKVVFRYWPLERLGRP
jgi:signal peptidase I